MPNPLRQLAHTTETPACHFVCFALMFLALAVTQAAEPEMLTNGEMEGPFVNGLAQGWVANGYYVLLDYDGRPKPTMMAYSALESTLVGAKSAGVMRRNSLTVHLFERRNGAVAVVWSAGARALSVPPGASVFDLMGNELPSPTHNPGEPVYVVAPGLKPAQLQQSSTISSSRRSDQCLRSDSPALTEEQHQRFLASAFLLSAIAVS